MSHPAIGAASRAASRKIAAALRQGGFSPTVLHRNLGSRAAELIEGSHQP